MCHPLQHFFQTVAWYYRFSYDLFIKRTHGFNMHNETYARTLLKTRFKKKCQRKNERCTLLFSIRYLSLFITMTVNMHNVLFTSQCLNALMFSFCNQKKVILTWDKVKALAVFTTGLDLAGQEWHCDWNLGLVRVSNIEKAVTHLASPLLPNLPHLAWGEQTWLLSSAKNINFLQPPQLTSCLGSKGVPKPLSYCPKHCRQYPLWGS